MKNLILLILTLVALVACEKQYENPVQPAGNTVSKPTDDASAQENKNEIKEEDIFAENREFPVGNSDCNKLVYNGRYGNDFNSAVDSLRRICRLDEYGEDGYEVMREPILNVHFNYDDRSFYSVWFQNENYLSRFFWLDDRGNNYDHLFCDD